MTSMDGETQLKVGSLVKWSNKEWSNDWGRIYPEGTFGILMSIDFDTTHPYTVRWFFSNGKSSRTSQMARGTLESYKGV